MNKPAFHDANTDIEILADILSRIVARMSVSLYWNAGYRRRIGKRDHHVS